MPPFDCPLVSSSPPLNGLGVGSKKLSSCSESEINYLVTSHPTSDRHKINITTKFTDDWKQFHRKSQLRLRTYCLCTFSTHNFNANMTYLWLQLTWLADKCIVVSISFIQVTIENWEIVLMSCTPFYGNKIRFGLMYNLSPCWNSIRGLLCEAILVSGCVGWLSDQSI